MSEICRRPERGGSGKSYNIISAEDYFEIREVPLVNLGGGFVITLSQVMGKISWVLFVLLFILLLLFTLIGFEHHLTRRALLHITENVLRQKNIISGRRGVSG